MIPRQLQHEPYENATEVEALMGIAGSCKRNQYNPLSPHAPRQQVVLEIGQVEKLQEITTTSTQAHAGKDVVEEDRNAQATGLAADTHAETDVNAGDNKWLAETKVRLRQQALNKRAVNGLSASPFGLFLFVVVAALFVTLSNDNLSRSI